MIAAIATVCNDPHHLNIEQFRISHDCDKYEINVRQSYTEPQNVQYIIEIY